jgi:hypothetical protein
MNYRVILVPSAEQELALAWLASNDRNAVTRAAHLLEQQLQTDPLHAGESRQSSVSRVAFESPLAIEFEVIEDDKKVRVLGVWPTE